MWDIAWWLPTWPDWASSYRSCGVARRARPWPPVVQWCGSSTQRLACTCAQVHSRAVAVPPCGARPSPNTIRRHFSVHSGTCHTLNILASKLPYVLRQKQALFQARRIMSSKVKGKAELVKEAASQLKGWKVPSPCNCCSGAACCKAAHRRQRPPGKASSVDFRHEKEEASAGMADAVQIRGSGSFR